MIHAPLTLDNVLINWKRDFYGFVYGNLLFNKPVDSYPTLSGNIVLKKSLLKDTFFTQEQQSLYGPLSDGVGLSTMPIGFNVRVISEKPIRAKTPSIDAYASVDIALRSVPVKGLYSTPTLDGTIKLDKGVLKFFRNKLALEYGKIQFVAGQMNDPIIDVVAKNRIGKYLVSLQITGSQQKPTIILESTPDLSEEQIIGLLLSGSEEATLQADVPSMVLKNLDVFLLNTTKNTNLAWLDKISKAFKYVQIVPNFNDETGQSALKGALSVNLGDQLRARVQKNLDLQKDFSAQLEYMLSDDINFKVVKDQGGELGSEVEMRFKLG
jgi:hypothetical protein